MSEWAEFMAVVKRHTDAGREVAFAPYPNPAMPGRFMIGVEIRDDDARVIGPDWLVLQHDPAALRSIVEYLTMMLTWKHWPGSVSP